MDCCLCKEKKSAVAKFGCIGVFTDEKCNLLKGDNGGSVKVCRNEKFTDYKPLCKNCVKKYNCGFIDNDGNPNITHSFPFNDKYIAIIIYIFPFCMEIFKKDEYLELIRDENINSITDPLWDLFIKLYPHVEDGHRLVPMTDLYDKFSYIQSTSDDFVLSMTELSASEFLAFITECGRPNFVREVNNAYNDFLEYHENKGVSNPKSTARSSKD